MAEYERLAIPPNTQLLSVERLPNGRWAIWTNTNGAELRKPHWERDGTYLMLNEDGSIDRITSDGNEMVAILEVLPKRETGNDDG